MVDQNSLIRVIESALELKEDAIDITSSSENTENWDSLGQLSILSALDELYRGKIAEIPEIASANSVKLLVDILKENNLLK